ncbi:hypothetical protein Hanom_Chr13g01191241 [Helianthus anomalus]
MVSGMGIGISIKITKPVLHRFLPSNTSAVPVPTGTEPYRLVPNSSNPTAT